MLKTFDETAAMIRENKVLHISASQELLSKLPAGNWTGGSSVYFAADAEKSDTTGKLWVFELDYDHFKIETYDENSITDFTEDTYQNGFTIIVLPAETKILQEYAQNSFNYKDILIQSHEIAKGVNFRDTIL